MQLTETEAEFCKYYNNVYNATLITFANSFYELCKAKGINYTNVKEVIVNRRNISNVYLDCNENIRGFGGVCLPKDTSAIASMAKVKLYPKKSSDLDKNQVLSSGFRMKQIKKLEEKMYQHVHDLEFEAAAQIRDKIRSLQSQQLGLDDTIAS